MKGLVVLSGGMDSATVLGHAINFAAFKDEIEAVHFQYGSKHNGQELPAAYSLAAHYKIPLTVVELPFVNDLFESDLLKSGGDVPEGHYEDLSMKRTVVPFRNGIMLAIAAGLAESQGARLIFLGNHAGDHAIYPDCRAAFTSAMDQAIAAGTYANVRLHAPFLKMTKSEIVRRGILLGVPFHLTWSCYKGGEKHCGKCGTCTERLEAFALAGAKDPVPYETEP